MTIGHRGRVLLKFSNANGNKPGYIKHSMYMVCLCTLYYQSRINEFQPKQQFLGCVRYTVLYRYSDPCTWGISVLFGDIDFSALFGDLDLHFRVVEGLLAGGGVFDWFQGWPAQPVNHHSPDNDRHCVAGRSDSVTAYKCMFKCILKYWSFCI